jgi:hypothetical protein
MSYGKLLFLLHTTSYAETPQSLHQLFEFVFILFVFIPIYSVVSKIRHLKKYFNTSANILRNELDTILRMGSGGIAPYIHNLGL